MVQVCFSVSVQVVHGAGIDKTTEWYRCVFVEVGHSAGIDKTAECYRCVLVSLWG